MTDKQFDAIEQQIQALREEIRPVVDTFNTLRWIGKGAAVTVAFLGSITALGLGIKSLFKR
jgi:hypothetical protein